MSKNIGVAYGLWALGFFGLCGIHRFYLEKPITGCLWLFTGGLLFIGQIVDFFLIPSMVGQQSLPSVSVDNQFLNAGQNIIDKLNQLDSRLQATIASQKPQNSAKSTSSSGIHKLLEVAEANGNVLSLGQAVQKTGLSVQEVQKLLDEAIKQGIAHVGNDPETGAVRYYFDL